MAVYTQVHNCNSLVLGALNTKLPQVVFATILERIFFKSIPSVLSVIGTLIIVTSALYVAVSDLPKNSNRNITYRSVQLTKEQTKKTKPSFMTLEIIHEDALEEGLLERSRDGDNIKDPAVPQNIRLSPKPQSRSSLDSDISTLSPSQTTKALSQLLMVCTPRCICASVGLTAIHLGVRTHTVYIFSRIPYAPSRPYITLRGNWTYRLN